MSKIFRIVDANVNRASEGLRVLEDLSRFYYNNKALCEKLKKIRHDVRKNIMEFLPILLEERNSILDIGFEISNELKIDIKKNVFELITANFKRVQEALRTIEENLKLLGKYEMSKLYEAYRFKSYSIEKEYLSIDYGLIKLKKLEHTLYCLTAEKFSNGKTNIEVVKSMIKAGVKIIQYREKEKDLLQKYNECIKIRELTKESGTTFIVNDDIALAMMVKADGIHIGQDDLPLVKVRELVGDKMIIGISTHSPVQAKEAVLNGADYIGVGPIFRTFTKKDVCEPVGLEYLEYVVENIKIPFVAIGGIKEHNLHEVVEKGAKCIALVTEIVGSYDVEKTILNVMAKIKGGK